LTVPGRNPKPVPLARLSGDRRVAARNPVDMPFAVPVAPNWLTKEASREWDEITPVLARMRVLTEADRIALAQLCDYLARWKHAAAMIDKQGYAYPVKDAGGRVIAVKRSPYVAIHLEYGVMIQRLLSQFGMTPSARARITQNEATKEATNIFSRLAAIQSGPRLESA